MFFIPGNVFVFRTQDDFTSSTNKSDPMFCDDDLYSFAFWSIVSKYTVMAVITSLIIVAFCWGTHSKIDEL